jgi:hypothetical protein
MTARRTTQPQSTADPAKFDVEGFASKFKPPLVSAKMFHRADLIRPLKDLLDQIEKARDAEPAERSFAETDPLIELIEQYNAMQAEFEAGGFELFEFRPATSKLLRHMRVEWLAGSHKDDDEWATLMLMARTCVSHPGITADAFDRLWDDHGDEGFGPVMLAVTNSMSGGGVSAPFLPLPLPTPATVAPSSD